MKKETFPLAKTLNRRSAYETIDLARNKAVNDYADKNPSCVEMARAFIMNKFAMYTLALSPKFSSCGLNWASKCAAFAARHSSAVQMMDGINKIIQDHICDEQAYFDLLELFSLDKVCIFDANVIRKLFNWEV